METGRNYYELLEVSRDSSVEEIKAAYAKAVEFHSNGSGAMYSLYTPEEKEALLEELKKAYETLTDPVRKSDYNARLTEDMDYEIETSEIDLGAMRETAPEEIARKERLDERPPLRARKKAAAPRPRTEFTKSTSLKRDIVASNGTDTVYTEQYRVLFTKLEALGQENRRMVYAVTSSVKGEGKTTTSLNFAYVMAKEFNLRVALVECDMRDPTLDSYFALDFNTPGLVGFLEGDARYEDSILNVEGVNLCVIPAGTRSGSPKPLSSLKMHDLINRIRDDFDIVILDSPPVLPLADINIISKLVDGLLLVVRAGRTPREKVLRAVKSIPQANIVGIVLNGTDGSLKEYTY